MARMIPKRIPEDVPSRAERRIFDLIEAGLADDWTALYSLGLSSHPAKPWAEIDFALVGPPGVFCLEVKGGRVSREDGVWVFTDRYDRAHRKPEGPFEQGGSASAALHRYLAAKSPDLGRVLVGYGVAMPDVRFDVKGPDVEPRILYDERDADRTFEAYVHRMVDFWGETVEKLRGRPADSLSSAQIAAVVEELRPDFDCRVSLRALIGQVQTDLLRLTNEQYRVLDGLAENPRVIVRGGAGTGKTLLAVYEAQSRADRGERVLLCCYNRQLAQYLQQANRDRPNIDVYHLHGLMADFVREAGLACPRSVLGGRDLFTHLYPKATLDALLILDRLEVYDALLVDEAQDLLLDTYLEVFDALLKARITEGTWRFFLDPNQNLFHATAPDALEYLLNIKPVQYKLSVNCRNTAPIATATAILSNTGSNSTLVIQGPEVQQYWYGSSVHQCREVSRCILRLLSSGIKPENIVVLSRYRRENSCLRHWHGFRPFQLVDLDGKATGCGVPNITFNTVAAFKGLESDVIVLVDVDDLEQEDALLSIYVGASRARALLAVFIDEKLKGIYDRHAFEYGRKLACRTETDRAGFPH